ncbi:MAG: hypothetical protein NTU72_10190, partial [Fimbriimonadales bacterium]|nr:hypothetical protein [Fimbriimonadales bacterium]
PGTEVSDEVEKGANLKIECATCLTNHLLNVIVNGLLKPTKRLLCEACALQSYADIELFECSRVKNGEWSEY